MYMREESIKVTWPEYISPRELALKDCLKQAQFSSDDINKIIDMSSGGISKILEGIKSSGWHVPKILN